jgi:hypothetical protein
MDKLARPAVPRIQWRPVPLNQYLRRPCARRSGSSDRHRRRGGARKVLTPGAYPRRLEWLPRTLVSPLPHGQLREPSCLRPKTPARPHAPPALPGGSVSGAVGPTPPAGTLAPSGSGPSGGLPITSILASSSGEDRPGVARLGGESKGTDSGHSLSLRGTGP